jgi:hypothetical protein
MIGVESEAATVPVINAASNFFRSIVWCFMSPPACMGL